MTQTNFPNIGLLGELDVERRLVQEGWHPIRLDTAQLASNADLLAVKREKRVAIQVKTTDASKQSDSSQWLGFGYSTGFLKNGKPIFNSKDSPLIADVIVAVYCRTNKPCFVVMPVAVAEELCCLHCRYWYSVPKWDGTERSPSFPIYLCYSAQRKEHQEHHEKIRLNLEAFDNAWDVLTEPIDKLHDRGSWPLNW